MVAKPLDNWHYFNASELKKFDGFSQRVIALDPTTVEMVEEITQVL